jgi:hypothetical protein
MDIIRELSNCDRHLHKKNKCQVISIMEKYMGDNNILTGIIFEIFMDTSTQHKCKHHNLWEQVAINYITNMKNDTITPETFKYFSGMSPNFLECLYDYCAIYKEEIDKLVLNYYDITYIRKFNNNMKFNNDNISALLSNTKLNSTSVKEIFILLMGDKKCKVLSSNVLLYYFKNRSLNDEILRLILFTGCKPDDNIIKYLCLNGKYEDLQKLIHHVKITDEIYYTMTDYKHRIIYTELETKNNIIQLFIKNGYKIKRENIIDSVNKQYYINNISEHLKANKMSFDEIIQLQIDKHGHTNYPYIKTNDTIIPNLLYYVSISSKNIESVMRVITETNIIPDVEYLEEICMYNNTSEIIEYILNVYDIPVTKKCIFNSLRHGSSSYIYTLLNKIPDGILSVSSMPIKDNSLEQNDVNILKLGKSSKYPKDNKKPVIISENSAALLKLNKKSILFGDLKKKFIDYVKKKFLLEKNYVKINKSLSEILDIKENSCIRFSDIENIVALCIE